MMKKRFVQLGNTHIKDCVTGEEYYAPCENGLIDLLNSLNDQLYSAQISLIYEYSTDIATDEKELKKTLYGDLDD